MMESYWLIMMFPIKLVMNWGYPLFWNKATNVGLLHSIPLNIPVLFGLYFIFCWLVVSNIFYFPFHIWDVILPIDELHDFSRWWNCTTNQIAKFWPSYIIHPAVLPITKEKQPAVALRKFRRRSPAVTNPWTSPATAVLVWAMCCPAA